MKLACPVVRDIDYTSQIWCVNGRRDADVDIFFYFAGGLFSAILMHEDEMHAASGSTRSPNDDGEDDRDRRRPGWRMTTDKIPPAADRRQWRQDAQPADRRRWRCSRNTASGFLTMTPKKYGQRIPDDDGAAEIQAAPIDERRTRACSAYDRTIVHRWWHASLFSNGFIVLFWTLQCVIRSSIYPYAWLHEYTTFWLDILLVSVSIDTHISEVYTHISEV